jgi:hypothetical protein
MVQTAVSYIVKPLPAIGKGGIKPLSVPDFCLERDVYLFWEYLIYPNLSIKCSPTLRAFAIIVKEGLTAELEGKKLPSTT